jgi:predicted phosphodiesterase
MSASKLAVVSNIRGNSLALEAVLADMARRRVVTLVCLGDVAGGGPQPREAIEAARRLGCPVVRGNADEWLLGALPAENADDDGGHTHWQMLRRYRGGLLVNVGSVGLPVGWLDHPAAGASPLPRWAEYAIVEAGRRALSVELCRVAVDTAALERAALESGVPHADHWAVDLERRGAWNAASIRPAGPAAEGARPGAPR